jgi:hypothetical protein
MMAKGFSHYVVRVQMADTEEPETPLETMHEPTTSLGELRIKIDEVTTVVLAAGSWRSYSIEAIVEAA